MRSTSALILLTFVACDSSGDDAADATVAADVSRSADFERRNDATLGDGGGTTDIGPEIDIDPPALQLLSTVGVESEATALRIRNVGTDPLEVSSVAAEGAAFALRDLPELPVVVAPGETLMVSVTYTPPDAGGHQGAVLIGSNDADEPLTRVPLTGRISRSCIRAMPSTIDLGPAEPGGSTGRFRVQVNNCGDVAIQVGEVRLDGDEGFGWEVEQGELVEAVLEPGEVVVLGVWYENMDLMPEETVNAALVVSSDVDVLVCRP